MLNSTVPKFPFIVLRPLVALRPPSHFLIHSLYPFCPRHNSLWRSLSMLVLSYSDTQNLNGYIGWCGCYEILIPCSTTVPSCRISLMCGEPPLNSSRSFVSTLVLVVVDSSLLKIEEFFHKMAISLRNYRVEQKNHFFLTE